MIPKVYEFLIYTYADSQQTKLRGVSPARVVARNKRNAVARVNRELEMRPDLTHVRYSIIEKSWLKTLAALLLPKYSYKTTDKKWERP